MEKEDWSLHELLRSMRLDRTYAGYLYLIYILELARKEPERLELVTKQIYPDVARAFGTTSSKVDGALRTAARVCWQRGPWEVTGRKTEREKSPSVKVFLKRLAQMDRQNRSG